LRALGAASARGNPFLLHPNTFCGDASRRTAALHKTFRCLAGRFRLAIVPMSGVCAVR